MGNSCKKKFRIMRNRSLSKDINNCFYSDDENNNSLSPQKVYIDLCDKQVKKYEQIGRNNRNILDLNENKKGNRNSSIIYIDELYNILGNKEKIKLKKLDSSDVEQVLVIKKHVKYKRKRKRKKKKKNCIMHNIDSYGTDKYNRLSSTRSDNNNRSMRNEIKKTKEKYHKALLYYENDDKKDNFDSLVSLNVSNKKIKKKSNLKLDDIEACCNSSESKYDTFVKDKKYDIFEEDRIYLLKKRREEMNQKNGNFNYITNKKNTNQNNSIYTGDMSYSTIFDTLENK
ncbi:conserved Plasmodium protein, unknown function [Plasmodium chabaudi adami]|uniref:Uncharacterized protein n=1 Tax=Plasmodium chabaudi adami TaxID=5826 RepID=A0A1C6YFR3_PLACE|nr:conserved Plasmodium protein, unknown function [Plasmodium chabaudi adami]